MNSKKAGLCLVAPLLLLGATMTARAERVNECFEAASVRYDVSRRLLEAIASVESAGNPAAINKNVNGSEDIGLMQINSSWLPTLKKYGINRSDLFDPCVSINVGAWIMADNIARHGYSWEAVGAYNAVNPKKRLTYAYRVAQALTGE
jgi:soluble lytic murein transglycosylase-like protein